LAPLHLAFYGEDQARSFLLMFSADLQKNARID
jgi:hypothetical protein